MKPTFTLKEMKEKQQHVLLKLIDARNMETDERHKLTIKMFMRELQSVFDKYKEHYGLANKAKRKHLWESVCSYEDGILNVFHQDARELLTHYNIFV